MAMATLDYTLAAPHSDSRADYSEAAIKECLRRLGLKARDPVADIGAGTGKLTAMLGRAGLHVQAIEPCAAMRELGLDKTCGMPVEWHDGTAEALPLADCSVDTLFFGSCWNEVDQERALQEAQRAGRSLCVLYNIRDTSDPLQAELHAIVRTEIPSYAPPPTAPSTSPLLTDIEKIEDEFLQIFDRDTFLDAWRSSPALHGNDRLIARLADALDDLDEIEVPYTTVAWIARFR
jgi:SAM-dependent methyltransferase